MSKTKKRQAIVPRAKTARFSDQLLNMTEEQAKVKLGELMSSLMVDATIATERLFEMAKGRVAFSHSEMWVLANGYLNAGNWQVAHYVMGCIEMGAFEHQIFYHVLVKHYLQCGSHVEAVGAKGRSLLEVACVGNDYVASSLIIEGAKISDALIEQLEQERNWYLLANATALNPSLMTSVLATRCLWGMLEDDQLGNDANDEFLSLLLAAGADPNVSNGSPLLWAVNYGEDDIAFELIEAGADIYLLDEDTRQEILDTKFMPKTTSAYRRMELHKKASKSKSRKRAWAQGLTTELRAM
jgi:hypothetical protein